MFGLLVYLCLIWVLDVCVCVVCRLRDGFVELLACCALLLWFYFMVVVVLHLLFVLVVGLWVDVCVWLDWWVWVLVWVVFVGCSACCLGFRFVLICGAVGC